MAAGGRKITLVSNAPGAASRVPATKEEMEASWAASVTQSSDGRHTSLNIRMGGRSMDDKTAQMWCAWFEKHLSSIVSKGRKASARDINFSENRLTSAGVDSIFKTLMKLDISVTVLKLYKNQIEKAAAIVDFVSYCKGSLRELHLSHNCLDTHAARDLILTCATLNDANGEACYPRNGTAPLWLRLESNDKINGPKLGPELQAGLQRTGRPIRRSICEVDGKSTCNPNSCCRSTPPAVHLTYMKLFQNCDPDIVSVKKTAAPAKPPAAAVAASAGQVVSNGVAGGAVNRGWGKPSTDTKPAATPNTASGSTISTLPQLGGVETKTIKPDAGFGPETEAKLDEWVQAKRVGDFRTSDSIQRELEAQGIDTKIARPDPRKAAANLGGVGRGQSEKGETVVAKPAAAEHFVAPESKPQQTPAAALGEADFPSLGGGNTKKGKTAQKVAPASVKSWGSASFTATQSESCEDSGRLSDPELPSLQTAVKRLPGSKGSNKAGKARGPATPQLARAPSPDASSTNLQHNTSKAAADVDVQKSSPPGLAVRPPPGLEEMCLQPALSDQSTETSSVDAAWENEVGRPSDDGCNTTTLEVDQPPAWEGRADEASTVSEDCATKLENEAVTCLMLAVEDYHAEANGYLSVKKGEHVKVWLEFQAPGDAGCAYPTYTYAQVRPKASGTECAMGWLPPHVVWERYLDDAGRGWAHDASTGDFVWEDEL